MNNRNIDLTILKAFGIIAVVSCHLGESIFKFIGLPISPTMELFPEYSYHMPLFIFASGYFYKTIYESDILKLAKKRFSSIKKYMLCNLFYLILSFILVKFGLLLMDLEFNLKSLFIEPFLGGFQFYFNGPAWFVPFLFLLQITYISLRKVISLKFNSFNNKFSPSFKNESIFLIILLVIGFISTSISNIYPVIDGNVNILQSFLRILFGLAFFQLGFYYKEFIQERLNLSVKSFLWVLLCKLIIFIIFGYYTFSLRTIDFNNHIILPYVSSILGIIYYLHLVKFIVRSNINSKILSCLCIIGNYTWSIMMHHLLVKWCLNGIYNFSFMPNNFKTFGNYLISPILCILLPILFAYVYEYIINKFKNKKNLKANLHLNAKVS